MEFTYYTNHAMTTKSLTEWYFGKKFVKAWTESLQKLNATSGQKEIKIFQQGTGFLTIKIN